MAAGIITNRVYFQAYLRRLGYKALLLVPYGISFTRKSRGGEID